MIAPRGGFFDLPLGRQSLLKPEQRPPVVRKKIEVFEVYRLGLGRTRVCPCNEQEGEEGEDEPAVGELTLTTKRVVGTSNVFSAA